METHMELTEQQIESVIRQFDAYCKTVLRNEARNLAKKKSRREKHEFPTPEPFSGLTNTDKYPSDCYVIETDYLSCVIANSLVYECLSVLPERNRDALILQFCEEWNDKQIAQLFGVVTRTVRKWRHASFCKVRSMLEKELLQGYADDRTDFSGHQP